MTGRADVSFAIAPVAVRSARACSVCGALVYDRDDAEAAHRRFHAVTDRPQQ